MEMDDDLSSFSWKLKQEPETLAKVWSHEETLKFLQIYEKLITNGCYSRKKFLWIDVADNMRNDNFEVSARQCENKWKTFTRSFREKKKHAFSDQIKKLIPLDPLENNDTSCKWEFEKSVTNDRDDSYRFSLQEHDYFPNTMNFSKTWSRYESERLIDHYKRAYQSANVPKVKKDMWDRVSASLQLEKINVTGSQCENKWKTLLRAYKNSLRSTKYVGKARLYEKLEDAISMQKSAMKKIGTSLPFKKCMKSNIIIAEFEDRDDDDDEDEDNDDDDDDEDDDDEIIKNVTKTESEDRKFYFYDVQTNKEEILETSPTKVETSGSFETKFLDYLHKKENARQKRHEENLEIKKRKLNLMEQLINKQFN